VLFRSGGEAFDLILGASKTDFSTMGFNSNSAHPAGWDEVGNTVVFYPTNIFDFDAIKNFEICVSSTTSADPYAPPSRALGDGYPYYDAPC